jgi:hypothetical protein
MWNGGWIPELGWDFEGSSNLSLKLDKYETDEIRNR